MVQRIQSLFLLVACIAYFIIVFHPITKTNLSDGSTAKLTSIGLKPEIENAHYIYLTFPIAILASVCGLMSLLAIFLYNKRQLQLRLCVYNILLTFVLVAVIFLYYFLIKHKHFDGNITVSMTTLQYPVILPLVNIILLFQAFRAIRRDDLLIKSYDRLR